MGIIDLGLLYRRVDEVKLTGVANANWAGSPTTERALQVVHSVWGQ